MGTIIKFNDVPTYKGEVKMSNLKKERMLEIEKITSELLNDVDFSKSPCVEIVPLVEKEGFDVKTQEMDIETTGCLFVDDEAESKIRLILVNTIFRNPENESDVIFKKSRFITAHEYGHFILHRKNNQSIYAHRDTYHRTEPIEIEADYFARSILMPLNLFKAYYSVANEFDNHDEKLTVDLLSRLFKVTRNKVKMRMEDLAVLE